VCLSRLEIELVDLNTDPPSALVSLAMDPPCLVEIDGVTHLNGGRRRPRLGVKERET